MTNRVFIGSSSSTRERGLLSRLVVEFAQQGFTPLPWYESFDYGDITIDRLTELASTCDFGAFVFAHDDLVERTSVAPAQPRSGSHVKATSAPAPTTAAELATSEETLARSPATRDNVVFEYGLFVATLGKERVLILEEDGVKLPSDLHAVMTGRFPSTSGALQNASLSAIVFKACKVWLGLPRRRSSAPDQRVDDAGLGFTETLAGLQKRIQSIVDTLGVHGRADSFATDPIEFDSLRACIATYREALLKVNKRFWTTTFLTSGFWTEPSSRNGIAQANSAMTSRLKQAGLAPRRLFLLHQPPASYAEAEKEHRIHLRRLNAASELDRRNRAHREVKDHIHRLLEEGCELRVAYDGDGACDALRNQLAFDCTDSELAIYDDFRVDVFGGGRTGTINRVTCHSPALKDFPQQLDAAERFFGRLWAQGEDVRTFLERLDRSIQKARDRIDYETNWLMRYEFELAPADRDLKTFELGHVSSVLKQRGRYGKIKRYLDIGTCTARYPIRLSEAVVGEGEIIGIDDDLDCIQFATYKLASERPNDARVRILREDFSERADTTIEPSFDLNTGMLGTLSHFGRDRKETHDDMLQRTLERMSQLLSNDGLLLLGTWSDSACQQRSLLSIYKEYDCELLSQWTPSSRDLRRRLKEAGFTAKRTPLADVRLDFWVCEKRRDAAIQRSVV